MFHKMYFIDFIKAVKNSDETVWIYFIKWNWAFEPNPNPFILLLWNGLFWDVRIYRVMWPISVTIILGQNFWGPPRSWKISKVKTWHLCLLGNKVQKVQLVHRNQNGRNYNPESIGTKLEIFIIFAVLCHFWT